MSDSNTPASSTSGSNPSSPLLASISSLPPLTSESNNINATPIQVLIPTLQKQRRLERKRKRDELRELQQLLGHQLAGREPRTYRCDDCGQTFAKSAALLEHAKSHAPPSSPSSGEGEGEGDHDDEFVTVPHLKRERRISWPAGNGRIHDSSIAF